MPPLAALPAILPGIIGAGSGVAGAIEGAQAGGRQAKALDIQEQIAQQEMADKQKIFDLLQPFFQQYLGQGSPFLSMIQRAGAEQNAQQFNNAAGQLRNTMQTSGLGFGPSGATAAGIGGLATNAAQNASSTYLQNLLNNEQIKFQAAQGLNSLGGMAGGSQNQPNVGVNLQPQTLGSSIFGLSQILQGLTKNGGGNQTVGIAPPGVWDPMGPANPGSPPILPGPAPTGGSVGGFGDW